MLNNITQKICIKCHEPKVLDQFSRDSSYTDGRRSACNECRNAKRRQKSAGASTITRVQLLENPPIAVVPYFITPSTQDLPDPDRLPAAYLKSCSDYWIELVGGDEPVKRIA